MELYKSIVYLKFFILFFNATICYSNEYLENFVIPKDFEEKALVLNYNDSLTGIITIMPKENIFSKYTWLNLYKLKINELEYNSWLYDRLKNEVHNIVKVERLIRGPDSPIKDTLFDSARFSVPAIDDTIKKATLNPEWFCDNINSGFNSEGKYYQLYCAYPLGGFKFYLVLRLQNINNIYYYISASSLNNIRLRKVLEIADSFSLIK
jgi:hypothetical protein